MTIDIPRILVQPSGEALSGFRPFTLDVSNLNLRAQSDELWLQYLREGEGRSILGSTGKFTEERLEDYVVAGLIDKDDIAYDQHAELLYDVASQAVAHLKTLQPDGEVERVLRMEQRRVVDYIYSQMQVQYREEADSCEVKVVAGVTQIRKPTITSSLPPRDFRQAPPDLNAIGRGEFIGFQRNLHTSAKFDSDTERVMAIVLDRDSQKWFRPAQSQFHIYYRSGGQPREYQPDFVAETADAILMLEPKRRSDLQDPEVLAKKDAAVLWCTRATEEHTAKHGGKPWRHVLIPHDEIRESNTLAGLATRFEVT